MSTTPDLPPLMALQRQLAIYDAATVEQHPKRAFAIEGVISAAREAVRLTARASVPAAGSVEQGLAIAVVFEERGHPCSPMACARAGWEAFARMLARSAPSTPPDEATSRDALDAARYRTWRAAWLATLPDETTADASALIGNIMLAETEEQMDAAIDAARTQGDAA